MLQQVMLGTCKERGLNDARNKLSVYLQQVRKQSSALHGSDGAWQNNEQSKRRKNMA